MLVPVIQCRTMKDSVAFYTQLLDFAHVGTWPASGDPSFSILSRAGAEMFLSTHRGDGLPGQPVAVLTDDVNALFRKYVERGLDLAGIARCKPDSPVHQGVVEQTWGTLEFYVDDPDGNTVRFIQRLDHRLMREPTDSLLLTASEKIHDPDARLRQLGLKRVLFGADLATGGSDGNPPPRHSRPTCW